MRVCVGRDVNVRKLRVFGVLQRLAVTYCVVAVVELLCVTPAHQHAVYISTHTHSLCHCLSLSLSIYCQFQSHQLSRPPTWCGVLWQVVEEKRLFIIFIILLQKDNTENKKNNRVIQKWSTASWNEISQPKLNTESTTQLSAAHPGQKGPSCLARSPPGQLHATWWIELDMTLSSTEIFQC